MPCGLSKKLHPFEKTRIRPQYAPHLLIKPINLDAVIEFDIANRTLLCEVTHTLKHAACNPILNVANRPSQRFQLNGVDFSDLEVSSESDSSGLRWSYNGKIIQIEWSEAFKSSEERKIKLKYKVERPVSGMIFSGFENDEPGKPVYALTDHETERARYWLACVDYPAVVQTLSFKLIAPEHMTALANGRLQREEKLEGGKLASHWKLNNTCPSYLICLAVGEFERVDDESVNDMPISYFAVKGTPSSNIMRAFDQTPSMVKWIQKKLDSPFPWPKYYQIAAPDVGGAMENISLVTWNDKFLLDETWALERKQIMDTVNIHEMAHTYFGDLITIRHFEHVWMKESWATYMESVWIQDHLTEDDFKYEMFFNADEYIEETKRYVRPLVTRSYDSSWCMFDSHTYPGGAWRLHMLRYFVGDETFWNCVQIYVSMYRGKSVETDDFRKVFEREIGMNLTQFFDQWFYSPGYVQLKASHDYNEEKNVVKVTLEQTQKSEIPIFQVSIDVECITDKGDSLTKTISFLDSNTLSKPISFCSFELPKGSKLSYIRIDPGFKILMSLDFNPGQEMLFKIATEAADVPSRIRAHRELIKIGSFQALQKVKKALEMEKFYGVRIKAADSLGENLNRYSIDVLTWLLDHETNPKAMYHVAKNCKVKDESVRKSLMKFLERPDLPYRAKEFALENLGFQRCEDDKKLLMEVAGDDSQIGYHGFVRAGALKGLAHQRSRDCFDYLLARVEKSMEPFGFARIAAIRALALSAKWQLSQRDRDASAEILANIATTEHSEDIRKAAINALVILGTREKIHSIQASKALFPAQELPWVDDQIKKLEDSGKRSTASLEEKIEKLEVQVRKLQEQQDQSNESRSWVVLE